jgi:hypothetical protein
LLGTTTPGGTSVDNGSGYVIGRRFDTPYYMTGEIGEVRIYNYAIDQTQVTTDYNESLATFPPPPILLLKAVNYSGSGTWNDESGNSTNATKEAGTIAKNADGNGIVLDGSTGWTFANVALGNAWTVNVWYKNTSLIGYGGIITQKGGFDHCNLVIANVGNSSAESNEVSGSFLDSNAGQWYSGSAIPLVNGLWVNIQITWNGTSMITYVNGTLLGTTTPGGTSIDNGLDYSIGTSPDGVYVTGEIGEVRIYDYAINQTQVTADYNESLATFPNPLVLLKAINYSGSGTWNDESGNGKDATKENGTIAKNADGNGIVLNGSTSWTFPNVAAGAQWSLNTWFKLNSSIAADNYPQIIGQLSTPNNNMVINGSPSGFTGNFYTSGVWYNTNIFSLTVGSWTNIQLTWNGTIMKLYLNGILSSTTTPGGVSLDNGTAYFIGRDVNNYYITGEIGEVRIYNYAINQAKVTADYNESSSSFPPSPVLLLKAVNYSGSGTWNDESGNSTNATKETGTIAKNADGNGIVLDGSTSWTFPNVAVGNAWTVNVWYKNTMVTNGINSTSGIVNQIWSNGNINIAIGDVSGNQINLGFRIASGNWYIGTNLTSYFTPNTWVNLIGTWDGTNLKTYINNSLIENLTPGGTAVDNGSIYRIGRRWDGANYVTGEIGEVRIYNYAINQSKVTIDYYQSIGTFVPPLVLLKAINYSGTGTWNDQSGNSYNATKETGTIAKNVAGNGIVLNGSTSWTFPNVAIGNAWSVNVWYKSTGTNIGVIPCIIGQITNGNGWTNLRICDNSNNNVFLVQSTPSGNMDGTSFTLTNNIWTNIQATWNGTNLITYINGIRIGTTNPVGTMIDLGNEYAIGRGVIPAFPGTYVVGEIGEVRIYNYAINQIQVTSDYNQSLATFT